MRLIIAILVLCILTGCAELPDFSGKIEGSSDTTLIIKHKRDSRKPTNPVGP